MLEVEPVQSYRANHFVVLDELDRPADRIPGGEALLKSFEYCMRFDQCRESRHAVVSGDLGVCEDVQELPLVMDRQSGDPP
jgi:hypothetical protein